MTRLLSAFVAWAVLGPLAAGPAWANATLPASALADAVALARQGAAALAPAGARVEVEAGAPDPRLRLAPCTRVQAHWPGGARAWGRTRVGLRCLEGEGRWAVTVPVTVKVWAPALVGRAPLAAGTVIDADMLGTETVDWAAAPTGVLTDLAPLLGRTLARALPAGAPLQPADLKPRQFFAAGDTVRVVAVGPGFAVAGEGQALSPGVEGQPARVRTDSGRIVSGVPVGDKRLEVSL